VGAAVVNRDELNRAVSDARLDAVTGAIATTAGIALGANPVSAAVAGASGPALKLAQRLFARAVERRQNRAAQALEQAAAMLDVGLDIIEERVADHDARLELLARVLGAAAQSSFDQKVTALARVLADGLREDGPPDDSFVLAAALADMEVAHVLALRHLAAAPSPPDDLRRSDRPARGWEVPQIEQAMPDLAEVMYSVVAVLAGHGLIRDQGGVTYPGNIGPAVWKVTALGRRCLFLLGEGSMRPDGS